MSWARLQAIRSIYNKRLYSSIEQFKNEVNSIYHRIKKNKKTHRYGINLTNEVQGLFTGNYKISMKEVKEVNKWKDFPCSWIRRLNIVNMPILPPIGLQIQYNPCQYSSCLFCRN